jgi:aminoglycoside phosphotransferase (APT) family kinase protein
MNYDTTLTDAQLTRMLEPIAPDWQLRDVTIIETGHHAVARLDVGTPDGRRTCYLKATPPGKPATVNLEARLLAGLGAGTAVPVTSVLGVVDEHDDLPAPYVLLSTEPGEARSRTTLPSVSDDELRQIARETGRDLASLHAVDAVDAYGFLTHDGPALSGGVPPADFSTVAVEDPTTDWRERLDGWAQDTLVHLEETRFADVVPEVEPVLESRVDAVEGPFEPALARVDQSIENVLVADGDLTAWIDWEFTVAATPAYDLCCVAWSLAGGPYQFDADVPDRRPLVREALFEGYAAVPARGQHAPADVVEQARANRPCYELLSTLRSMEHLEDWFELFDLGDRVDRAASDLRTELADRLQAGR